MLVSEYQRDDELYNEPLLVTNVSWCTSAKGQAYISAILQDKSGTIDTKKWSVDSEDKEIWQVGNVLYITGVIIENNSKLQLKVLNCSKYVGAIEAEKFAGTAPEKKEDLVKELKEYINSIQDEDYKEVVRKILNKYNEDYLVFPAAVRNHHNFISGILYHTICILRMAKAVSTLYKDVNTDLLYSGAILHDVGKTRELANPLAPHYTVEGNLVGHISIGAQEVASACEELKVVDEKRILLEHMLLSHHGKQEFGSPVVPMVKEAYILSALDDFDAKMNIIDKALVSTPEGEFSDRVFPMDNRTFYKPKKKEK